MGKTDERLDRTQQGIEQALHACHGYHNLRRGDGWLPLRVYFGEADCCVTASFAFSFGARTELLVGVPADWLETVHAPGLALVNGAIVLQALPTPWDNPDEDSWEARVMMPGADNEGVELSCQFIVRFGGQTLLAPSIDEAIHDLHQQIRVELGLAEVPLPF
jgi:hypothetical protein